MQPSFQTFPTIQLLIAYSTIKWEMNVSCTITKVTPTQVNKVGSLWSAKQCCFSLMFGLLV